MTLIEVVVAVALLAVVITPAARLVIATGLAANQDRIRVEAVNVVTDDLENVQNQANFGVIDPGTTIKIQTLIENGSAPQTVQTFTVTTTYTLQTASGQSICTLAGGGAAPPQIWEVTASADWTGDGGSPAQQTTLIAPEQAGAIPQTAGELAVPVDTSAENGTLYTAAPVPITVSGTWTGAGPAPVVPGNQVIFAAGNTGKTGCAVFGHLDADAGWTYTVYLGIGNEATGTVANQTAVVTSQELPGLVNGSVVSMTAPCSGAGSPVVPCEAAPALVSGSPIVAAPFYVDPGATVTVAYITEKCTTPGSCIDVSAASPPAAYLPVTAQAVPQLTGTNNTFSFNTSATPLTISTAQLFPYSNYLLWAGDAVDSAPGYAPGGVSAYPGTAAKSLDATQPAPLSVTLNAYTVVLSVLSGTPAMMAVPVNASTPESYALSAFGALVVNKSSTGLPLGEYHFVVTGHSVTPAYVWVTPTKIYFGSAQQSTPAGFLTGCPTCSAPSGTAIPVVVT